MARKLGSKDKKKRITRKGAAIGGAGVLGLGGLGYGALKLGKKQKRKKLEQEYMRNKGKKKLNTQTDLDKKSLDNLWLSRRSPNQTAADKMIMDNLRNNPNVRVPIASPQSVAAATVPGGKIARRPASNIETLGRVAQSTGRGIKQAAQETVAAGKLARQQFDEGYRTASKSDGAYKAGAKAYKVSRQVRDRAVQDTGKVITGIKKLLGRVK